ncbi:YeeE/YedE family protein [Hyphomonadaceae bacterium ML37]|nr:YeeE/YedE family protein [Hyphomonadaceae bacterium ML37]
MDAVTPFTPVSALIGGALIGLSAIWLMAANGRIAGISGIAGGLIGPSVPDRLWRLAFVAGLIAAPLIVMLAAGPVAVTIEAGPLTLIAAGLLVGVGTQMGSGCTSGHGVCGLSLFSPRSLVSVAVFMAAGAVTVFITRHLIA